MWRTLRILVRQGLPSLRLRNPFVELILNKGRYITCSYIIPFLMGSQLARFVQHAAWYRRAETALFDSNTHHFHILASPGILGYLSLFRRQGHAIRHNRRPIIRKILAMVPVLVPLAFTGELVYRLDYFLANAGDLIPTFGRQFGINLEGLYVSVPRPVIYWICLLSLSMGTASSAYVLHIFNTRDFEGVIEKKRYYALHGLVLLLFTTYAVLFGKLHRFLKSYDKYPVNTGVVLSQIGYP